MTNYFNSSHLLVGIYNNGLLTMVFRDGSCYEYKFVSTDIWFGLVKAVSAGTYFHDNIRNNSTIAFKRIG